MRNASALPVGWVFERVLDSLDSLDRHGMLNRLDSADIYSMDYMVGEYGVSGNKLAGLRDER